MVDADIIVVGAGMVGATAALALARKGWRIILLEKQPFPEKPGSADDAIDPRVSAISPASAALLESLGCWPPEGGRVNDILRMCVWHQNGSSEMDFRAEQAGVPRLGQMIENRHLQATVLQVLQGMPGVRMISGVALSAIEQGQDQVRVVTSEGEQLSAALLIAADGRGSAVRRLLRLGEQSGDYRQRAIVAHVRTELAHQSTAWQRFLATGPLAFLPLWDGRSSIVWSADNAFADELDALDDASFRLRLEQALESRLGAVVESTERASFPLSWHAARRWLHGRVVLIGDAAHGVHPLAGQGVNLGFGDILALRQSLVPGDDPYRYTQLRRFERQRKAEAETAMHLFSALKSVYTVQTPAFCALRDWGMASIERQATVKSTIISKALHNMI
jgi:ubiquinone biosynthesis UbiH/UbiF/VisC/COQ6 family hydroxylase